MDYRSLFQTTVRILQQNKKVWLFSLIIALINPLLNLNSLIPRSQAVLTGCLLFIYVYLLIAGNLGILLIVYHGYLGETVNFRGLWKEINSYFLRVLGILSLCILVLIIPAGLLSLAGRVLPFIIFLTVLGMAGFYFYIFPFTYLQLGMFIKKFDIKYAATVMSYNKGAKLAIALVVTFSQILFTFFFPAIIQKGFSMDILYMNYQGASVLLKLPIQRILLGLYSWITYPVITAVVVSLYFKDLEAKKGVPQSAPQPDSTLKPLQ